MIGIIAQMKTDSFEVLLYYKYVKIDLPEAFRDFQRELCEKLGLKGRIIVASEGINGTVEGLVSNTQKYIDEMQKDVQFQDMKFKRSSGNGNSFPKLSVKVRPEIVASRLSVDPNKTTGKYLSAEQLHQWFEDKKEFYIVDMRNDYEHVSGQFEGSILADIHNFYDLPKVVEQLKDLKGKTILTVCTGGVRCEKASGFLVENGFEDVYQLKDGIVTYMEKYPNEHFLGKLYVFDNRLTIGFNTDSPDHKVIGNCMHCGSNVDTYVNCAYDICHLHYICCNNCKDHETGLAFCKAECKRKYLSQSFARNLATESKTQRLMV
jgi:UPF0176 protein